MPCRAEMGLPYVPLFSLQFHGNYHINDYFYRALNFEGVYKATNLNLSKDNNLTYSIWSSLRFTIRIKVKFLHRAKYIVNIPCFHMIGTKLYSMKYIFIQNFIHFSK